MDNTFAIETHDLTKKYGKRLAVDHLNLNVPEGSVFAFLGRNGAGKTTTIKMLLNLLDRTSGEVSVLGLDPVKRDVELKSRIGYVAEGQRMYDWMSVSQIAWFCAGFYKTWDNAYSAELIRQLELRPEDKLKNLSRGTQAKVGLLLALSHHPELLILDEPTAGLDVVVRREFIEGVIDLIQQEGRTVFFSSHLVHEVERIADWVGIVDGGRIIECRPVEDLKQSMKKIRLTFEDSVPEVQIGGQIHSETLARQMVVTVRDFTDKTVDEVRRYNPKTVGVEDMSLEDIFVALVGDRK